MKPNSRNPFFGAFFNKKGEYCVTLVQMDNDCVVLEYYDKDRNLIKEEFYPEMSIEEADLKAELWSLQNED